MMAPPQELEGKRLMQSGLNVRKQLVWQTQKMAFWSGSGGRENPQRGYGTSPGDDCFPQSPQAE